MGRLDSWMYPDLNVCPLVRLFEIGGFGWLAVVCLFVGGFGESSIWVVVFDPQFRPHQDWGGGRWPRISMEFGGSLFFQCGFVVSAKFLVEDSHFKWCAWSISIVHVLMQLGHLMPGSTDNTWGVYLYILNFMICIHPVASAILIVDYPTNPGQEEDEKVALFEVLNIGRAGIGCFHIFCSNQLLRSCHDRRQTIILLFNDNYFCQCYLQLLDDVYYHRYLQLIIMMIIIIIFFKCLFWLLINTRRIETYHLWILSLYMNSRHQTLYVSWLWTAQDRNLHADLLLKCIQETPSCDPMVCLSWLWFLLLLRDGYSPYLLL